MTERFRPHPENPKQHAPEAGVGPLGIPPPTSEQSPQGGGSKIPEFASLLPQKYKTEEPTASSNDQREKRRAYQRQYYRIYRKEKKEKMKEHKDRYKQNNGESIKDQQSIYYQKNKEELRKKRKIYYQKNKNKIRHQQRQYLQKRKEEHGLQMEQQEPTQVFPTPKEIPNTP